MGLFKADSLEDFVKKGLNVPLREKDPVLYDIIDKSMQNMRFLDHPMIQFDLEDPQNKTLHIHVNYDGRSYVQFSLSENNTNIHTPVEQTSLPGFYISKKCPSENQSFKEIAKNVIDFIKYYIAPELNSTINAYKFDLLNASKVNATYEIKTYTTRTDILINELEKEIENSSEDGIIFKTLSEAYVTFFKYEEDNKNNFEGLDSKDHFERWIRIQKIINSINILYDTLLVKYTLNDFRKSKQSKDSSSVNKTAFAESSNIVRLIDAAKNNIQYVSLDLNYRAA